MLKQRGDNGRRGSLFGSTNIVTSDPLQKLLQTKRYLQSGEGSLSQIQSERSFTSRLGRGSTPGNFKNEYLQQTLNQTSNDELVNLPLPMSQTMSKSQNRLSYRDRLFIKHIEQQNNFQIIPEIIPPNDQLQLTEEVQKLGKSPQSMINDTVQ